MTRLTKAISNSGINLCSVYCADGTFINEPSKYLSACLTSVATMTQISLPHLNVLTKCDKIQDKELLERMQILNFEDTFSSENSFFNKKFMGLN
jgi:GTP-binding protein EngB required for normal cell division